MSATPEEIARVAHEVNRAYCEAIGEKGMPSWRNAPEWMLESLLAGVWHVFNNPDVTPAQSHASWLARKYADGWTYGEVKDFEKLTHPCMMPYEELPEAQRVKDALFLAVVKTMAGLN